MTCQARQYSDQMQCGRCGLAWDVNDPEPPRCSPRPAPLPLSPEPYRLNTSGNVAVAADTYWNEDMTTCPRGAKVQLLGAGGVAFYGSYHGDPFWVGWAPVPRRRPL